MECYETNIFPIKNLGDISSTYQLYKITGLQKNLDEYNKNIQLIIKQLSYKLKHPVTVINHENEPHLVIKDDPEIAKRIPNDFQLVRNKVYFSKAEEELKLDYRNYTGETKQICLRFLWFDIQSELFKNPHLWQPSTGKPFFSQKPKIHDKVAIYDGFNARVVELPDTGFGIALDVTKKYVSSKPLDTYLDRNDFKKIKGKRAVYRFPGNWYEVKLEEFNDLTVSQHVYKKNGEEISLIDDLRQRSRKPLPRELAKLPDDATVLFYRNNSNTLYGVPSALCYVTYDTEDKEISRLHRKSILAPHKRRRALSYCTKYFQRLKFGNIDLNISKEPYKVPKKVFDIPDFEFGNNHILSVNGTDKAENVKKKDLGTARKHLLTNSSIGFYSSGAFDRQYFVMPQSVEESFGQQFLNDLKDKIDQMYPDGGGYDPTIITYDDREDKNYVERGLQIVDSIIEQKTFNITSYGLVMIPEYRKDKRMHDELAALVIRELREEDIHVSVIHTSTASNSYYYSTNAKGEPVYKVKGKMKGKLYGYLRNVAINKVLLTNSKWPYVLDTPLNADLTIGIDVKNNTAGFTFISKYGKQIRTEFQKSNQREKLTSRQLATFLTSKIGEEVKYLKEHYKKEIKNIVFHRDGRLFESEQKGILKAVDDLKGKTILSDDVQINIIEIPKHSLTPFRLFEVIEKGGGKEMVYNPKIGSYLIINEEEAYLCSTGREFVHKGTSNPLYVKLKYGTMPFEDILQDVYFLTTLAFTRPEDCSRYPLTIKLTDRKLMEVASEYDEEELNLLLEESNIETL